MQHTNRRQSIQDIHWHLVAAGNIFKNANGDAQAGQAAHIILAIIAVGITRRLEGYRLRACSMRRSISARRSVQYASLQHVSRSLPPEKRVETDSEQPKATAPDQLARNLKRSQCLKQLH